MFSIFCHNFHYLSKFYAIIVLIDPTSHEIIIINFFLEILIRFVCFCFLAVLVHKAKFLLFGLHMKNQHVLCKFESIFTAHIA